VLGTGNRDIRQVTDPLEAARRCANVVFHPFHPNHELFDFVYKDLVGHFHAFQITTGKSHKASANAIMELEEKVGNATMLTFYFLVPSSMFPTFVTRPVKPAGVSCDIYHVSIPNPELERTQAIATDDDDDATN
jgi:hypothetical protein